jgi:hypothetical protein
MKLQQLFDGYGIDWKRTKLVRHNMSNPTVAENKKAGLLDYYQAVQSKTRFDDCDLIFSFLGTEGTNGIYLGCYRVCGSVPFDKSKMPEKFFFDKGMDNDCIFYKLEPLDYLSEYKDRLVIDWGRDAINWCQNGTKQKEILEIRPVVSAITFDNYENVILTFDDLYTIVYNQPSNKVWKDKLSAVAGVYLITDTLTGQLYVGSASGEQGGIWGRWSDYAHSKHGGNKYLKELIDADPDYCKHFQYSILEVMPKKRDRHEVIAREELYKKKLLTKKFGMNKYEISAS